MGAPLADEAWEPRVIASELVYRGRVWDVREDTFSYGDSALTRHYQDHPGAVAVLALDDEDRVLLIQQYRHPVRLREWEIPAGLLDVAGEDPLTTAQRELAEEADLVAARWALLADYLSSPGGSNEAIRIFLARGIAASDSVFHREGEEADMVLAWVPFDEVVDAVRAGRVQNSILQIAVLSAALERGRGWSGLRDAGSPWIRHPRWRNG